MLIKLLNVFEVRYGHGSHIGTLLNNILVSWSYLVLFFKDLG